MHRGVLSFSCKTVASAYSSYVLLLPEIMQRESAVQHWKIQANINKKSFYYRWHARTQGSLGKWQRLILYLKQKYALPHAQIV